MGHVFNLSLTMAKPLNLSLALDRTFEYEHCVINVTAHRGRIMGRSRIGGFLQVGFKGNVRNVYLWHVFPEFS